MRLKPSRHRRRRHGRQRQILFFPPRSGVFSIADRREFPVTSGVYYVYEPWFSLHPGRLVYIGKAQEQSFRARWRAHHHLARAIRHRVRITFVEVPYGEISARELSEIRRHRPLWNNRPASPYGVRVGKVLAKIDMVVVSAVWACGAGLLGAIVALGLYMHMALPSGVLPVVVDQFVAHGVARIELMMQSQQENY